MPQYRDVVLKEKAKQDRKQDLLKFQRAVLTDAQGNQTGSGSVWASQSERRVWCMTSGAIQPGQVLCVRVSDPVIGLGVIIGYADGSNEKEVLSDDFFLRKTGDPTGWYSTSPGDLEPGGLKMMWIYSKVITPLATYPDPTGLSVNVIAGDYPYAGARVSFGGQSGYLLVEPATPGEHYYAGLYLDSSNTLQVVYGAAVVLATAPPEPTWPAGSFRLSVVKIANGQTSLNFNDDVFDRRMAWSDEGAGSGGWPFAHVLTVSATDPDADYSTVAAAITAAATGDVILLDAGSYGPLTFTLNKDITLRGPAVGRAILTNNTSSTTLTVSTAGARVENITVANTDEGNAISVTAATATLERVIASTLGAGSIKSAIVVTSATKCTLLNCEATASGASLSNSGLLVTSSGICDVFGGIYNGATNDMNCASGNTLNIYDAVLVNNTVFPGGTIGGHLHTTIYSSTNSIIQNPNVLSDSTFICTIATLPGGAVLTYTVTSGDEGWLDAVNSSALGKLRLYNSTRSTYALISDTVIATNTITLTATVPGDWVVGDTLTIRSQTNTDTAGGAYFLEYEITSTEIPTSARTIIIEVQYLDLGGVASIYIHPYEAFSLPKASYCPSLNTGAYTPTTTEIPFISRRFTMRCEAFGSGTSIVNVYLKGYGAP